MKRLLRTGWIRAGVPKCDIESLADHSWAVAILTYCFVIEENALRADIHEKPSLNIERAVFIALFHDFLESEYLDIDKSVFNLTSSDKIISFLKELEEGALNRIIKQLTPNMGNSLEDLMKEKNSLEYQVVRIADHVDLLLQTRDYSKKQWIDTKNAESFQTYALNQLERYLIEFLFLKPFLAREGFEFNPDQ